MMFKVGDEVLIKGEVVEVAKDVAYPIGVRLRCATVPMLFTEEELELSTKTYAQGLADAWDLAKKIRVQPSNGGIPKSELEEIFGTTFIDTIFKNNTYAEALAKIEAYEKEKSEIKVGDEVRTTCGDNYWIIGITDSYVFGYLSDTKRNMFPVQKLEGLRLKKTGRTTDRIDLLGR